MMGAHQVGDTVRNYPGFAAPGTGKNEKRAFGVLHRLALAGVEACEKIHGTVILARRYNALILKNLFNV